MSIFREKGHDAAMRDQESSDSENEFGRDSDPDFEIKPFTIKAAKFQLEIIDALAQHVGMTRSDFVKTIVLDALGDVFIDFQSAYLDAFATDTGDQAILDSLSDFLKTTSISGRSGKLLSDSVLTKLGLHDYD